MLVEDDPFISDLTSIELTEHKYTVLHAKTGEEVLILLQSSTPDLILLDLNLPGISGIDVLRKIREHATHKNIPVIIFSNNDSPELKNEAEKIGIQGFYIKALTAFEDLHTKIKLLLGE